MSKEFIALLENHRGKRLNKDEARNLYLSTSKEYRESVKEDVFVAFFMQSNKDTVLWHDYEGGGDKPSRDQATQFAGVRTTHYHEQIDVPIDIYCKPNLDMMPHPVAVGITKISPMKCLNDGLLEVDFARIIQREFMVPGTTTSAYNGIRYDDELTRYQAFRNFIAPYARENYKGRGRWDMLPLVCMFRGLRPDGINWPISEEGKNSIKLELIAKENNIVQESAHNAVDDVIATVNVARMLRKSNKSLYDFVFSNRKKKQVEDQIAFGVPLTHAHTTYGGERHFCSAVLPVCRLMSDKNIVVAIDLHSDNTDWLMLSSDALKERIYAKKDELEEKGWARPPIVRIKMNQCPALAPIKTMQGAEERIGVTLEKVGERVAFYNTDMRFRKAAILFQEAFGTRREFDAPDIAEKDLYNGFIKDSDADLSEMIHMQGIEYAYKNKTHFIDDRLRSIFPRFVGRNAIELMTDDDKAAWLEHCRTRLTMEVPEGEGWVNLTNINDAIKEAGLSPELEADYRKYIDYIKGIIAE